LDLVAQQLSASHNHHGFGVIKHEIRQLVRTEDKISDLLDRVEAQGLGNDAVFQEDQARLMQIEEDLAMLIAQAKV